MKSKQIIILVAVIIALFVTTKAFFVVEEYEQVVITQFGKPVGKAITTPGLHIKVPFIQDANYFEKRFMEWDGDPNQVPTKDKKFIFIDTYARWQITDPLQFYKRLTDERGAQSRIDDILDGEARNYIAKSNLEEVVRSTNRTPLVNDTLLGLVDSLSHISSGRQKIQDAILKAANAESSDLGIAILDFRFKRINYVKEVREQVYARMKSERYRIAEKFRSEGQGEASRINGERDKKLKTIRSEAFETAEKIKGKADAEAAAIYAKVYNQSPQSKSLYAFLKSLETFENTFNSKTSTIISTDSELYKYLKKMD